MFFSAESSMTHFGAMVEDIQMLVQVKFQDEWLTSH